MYTTCILYMVTELNPNQSYFIMQLVSVCFVFIVMFINTYRRLITVVD